MPIHKVNHSVTPLKILAQQSVQLRRANNLDFQFFKSIVDSATPEFGGFNTRLLCEQDHSLKPATKAVYIPLIDMVPTDPATTMTAMVEA